MDITINADLSSKILSEDGQRQCGLPPYNPETLIPFVSEAEVLKFAKKIYGNPRFFHKIEAPVPKTVLTPLEFKMVFTPQERVTIKRTAKEGDEILEDFLEVLNDVRLKEVILTHPSNIAAIGYLISIDILTPARGEEILQGTI